MRKIEQQMNRAINRNQNFASGNTTVIYDAEENESKVYLHGHLIAVVDDFGIAHTVESTLIAWPTRTTMSRLRALDVDVCTRKGDVYLDGEMLG